MAKATCQRRDLWLLALTLLSAPLALALYWFAFGELTTYPLLVQNLDSGPAGAQVVESLSGYAFGGDQPVFAVKMVADRQAAEAALRNRKAAALLSGHNGGP